MVRKHHDNPLEDRPEKVEAALALGNSAMLLAKPTDAASGKVKDLGQRGMPLKRKQALLELASETLQHAAELARSLGIKKLEFHAQLRGVQLACMQGAGYTHALDLHTRARAIWGEEHKFKGYLGEQDESVADQIRQLRRSEEYFVYTVEQLKKMKVPNKWNRLRVMRALADAWALKIALRSPESSERSAAEFLKIAESTIRVIREREVVVDDEQDQ